MQGVTLRYGDWSGSLVDGGTVGHRVQPDAEEDTLQV